jgi:hypothetical protein
VHFWQAVPEHDRAQFVEELLREVYVRVGLLVLQRTGIELSAEGLMANTELLLLWDDEPDIRDRLKAFEQGWSSSLPRGTRPRDLSSADLGQLVRRAGLLRPRRPADGPPDKVTPELLRRVTRQHPPLEPTDNECG